MKRLKKDEAFALLTKIDGNNRSESWNKYLQQKAKQNYYYQFDDNLVVEFDRSRIDGVMYYNDEYEAPSTALESFINYNMCHNLYDRGIEKWIEAENDLKNHGCCSGSHSKMWLAQYYDDGRKILSLETTAGRYLHDVDYAHESPVFVRYLTDDETKEILQAYEQIKQDYEKRLRTYYKRYHDKITTHGYWANR